MDVNKCTTKKCAALEANQLVSGCLTNDGDAFLFGARNVYRDEDLRVRSAREAYECGPSTPLPRLSKVTRPLFIRFRACTNSESAHSVIFYGPNRARKRFGAP